jgi:hypothetical protein
MINKGRYQILNNYIQACDYDYVLSRISKAINKRENLLISPIASHTLVLTFWNKKLQRILNSYDLLVPDSQWVKRSIYFLYGVRIKERVYGPQLMIKVCNLALKENYSIGLYGTTEETLLKLRKNLTKRCRELQITFIEPSLFRDLTTKEKLNLVKKIQSTRVQVLFLGLGSPLQEEFASEVVEIGKKRFNKEFSLICIPIGAAFDFLAREKKQAPRWMQDVGCEWFYRLLKEPKRLWKRYLIYGLMFIIFVTIQKIRILFNFSYSKSIK